MTGTTPTATTPDVASLNYLCRELAEAADAVGEAARYASELALGTRIPRSARGATTLRGAASAWRALLRALGDPAGLGWAPRGRGVARAAWLAGVLTSRDSLAVALAVLGLKARIAVATASHPELLDDPAAARILQALAEDRQSEAVRAFRRSLDEKGAEHALAVLAPSFADILAWNALTDENPFNDTAGWQVATGRAMTAEPLIGINARIWNAIDRGPGRAEPRTPESELSEALDTTGTITGYVRNIGVLRTGGLLLIQQVIGPDGVLRHVVQIAGMNRGRVNQDSPQDLAGAFNAVGSTTSPHSRAVTRAIRSVAPSGAELALVGHSQGGITAMNLAADRAFVALYPVTHVVAIGSPIDAKRPADPRTKVISLVNEHDIVPSLEGRSALSPYELPAGFTEFTWTDDTHEFPLCHAAERYADNLTHDVPEASAYVDTELAAYRGRVTATRLFQLYDR